MAADRAMAELKRKFAYLSPTQIDAMHADTVAIGTSHGAGDAAVSALAQSKKDLISMRSMRLSLLAPVDVPAHLDSDSDRYTNLLYFTLLTLLYFTSLIYIQQPQQYLLTY